MFVKINQAGWEGYTGDLGCVPFVDAVSTRSMERHEALALGANISIVEIGSDGSELGPISPSHELLLVSQMNAEVVEELPREVEAIVEPEHQADDKAPEPVALPLFIEAELKAIADEKGIAGLRDIASKLDVRDTSVRGLIAKILHAQANPKSEA